MRKDRRTEKDGSLAHAGRAAFPRWLVLGLVMAIAAITMGALWASGLRRAIMMGERAGDGPSQAVAPVAPVAPVAAQPVASMGAPVIVWGTPVGHEDRGPCTSCHDVVSVRGTRLPTISALSTMPHPFRGVCNNCHEIGGSWPRGLVPVAGPLVPAAASMASIAMRPPRVGGAAGRGVGIGGAAIAYSTLALMVLLAVSRPRLGALGFRFSPGSAALAGVTVLFLAGILTFEDMLSSAVLQWRPLLALTCIMIMTGVVQEVGVFDRIALRIQAYARRRSAASAFTLVFVVSVITAALLNNDSAILLLTPLVVASTRRLYPRRPELTVAFAFAVFLAPGVAPFVISNPMNMIVAEFAGIGFNAYARVMLPISIAGAVLTYLVLRLHFREILASAAARLPIVEDAPPHPAERPAIILLLAVFAAYPVMAALGGPVWVVSVFGALACVLLATHHRVAPMRTLLRHVSPDILVFLWGVFLVVVGLRHVGVVDRLAAVYQAVPKGGFLELGVIGGIAALGSALVDNHPMSLVNLMALGVDGGTRPLFAALIGGDIGPRLLPIGSLAGLLWMDLLRRSGVEIGAAKFARVGTLVLLPTLTLSLVLLWLLTTP